MRPEVVVLRYGHRLVRDARVTTHCCLVARAFGAKEIIINSEDKGLLQRIETVNKKWGGKFKIIFEPDWRKSFKKLKNNGFTIVHLTMYGEPINKLEEKIRKEKKIGIIIGSQKVEPAVYEESDYNISIGSQPHSEIAALAVFLDRLFNGKELEKKFPNAKLDATKVRKGKK